MYNNIPCTRTEKSRISGDINAAGLAVAVDDDDDGDVAFGAPTHSSFKIRSLINSNLYIYIYVYVYNNEFIIRIHFNNM